MARLPLLKYKCGKGSGNAALLVLLLYLNGVNEQRTPSKFRTWLKRIGWAGFFFFLIKGLVWIVVFLFFKEKLLK